MKVLVFFLVSLITAAQSLRSPSHKSTSAMVLTPQGYLPAECVHHVDKDFFVLDINSVTTIVSKDLTSSRVVPPCSEGPIQKLPNGWTAFTSEVVPTGADQYNGTWLVPPEPQDESTQTLFLFTGLQNNFGGGGITNIIQPVLQFGPSAAGGGQYWAIASWYVDSNSRAYFSQLTNTKPGNIIQGNMSLGADSTWTVASADISGNTRTTLTIKTNTTEPYVFVTLEVYGVTNCLEFPTGSDRFTNLAITQQGREFVPAWKPQVSPGCDEAVNVISPYEVEIVF